MTVQQLVTGYMCSSGVREYESEPHTEDRVEQGAEILSVRAGESVTECLLSMGKTLPEFNP